MDTIHCKSGESYIIDESGVITQVDPKPYVYDQQYLDYYEGLKERTIRLGFMRAGYINGYLQSHLKRPVKSILEFGYGSGSFLDAAKKSGIESCNGTDIQHFPLPDGCSFLNRKEVFDGTFDVVAMFDVLEHIETLQFLELLKTKYLFLTVPLCKYNSILGSEKANEWFEYWRMRRPNEHIHHFDEESLVFKMAEYGYRVAPDSLTYMENPIRLREGESGHNVFTMIFER
tara:strand:- start:3047 stop:3736 length:690 start_codon:yes stop_codon:yes gene_type:complete